MPLVGFSGRTESYLKIQCTGHTTHVIVALSKANRQTIPQTSLDIIINLACNLVHHYKIMLVNVKLKAVQEANISCDQIPSDRIHFTDLRSWQLAQAVESRTLQTE